MPRSTGWRACWSAATTRFTSRGGWCASPREDVGLADPHALPLAMAAQQAVHFLGMPEGALALAELAVYLALAPKSNAVYRAYGAASADVATTRNDPVPIHLRNAPTRLMKRPRATAKAIATRTTSMMASSASRTCPTISPGDATTSQPIEDSSASSATRLRADSRHLRGGSESETGRHHNGGTSE